MCVTSYLLTNSLLVRRWGFNFTVYFNRQITDNMHHVGGDPRMRKGYRVHIRSMKQLWPPQYTVCIMYQYYVSWSLHIFRCWTKKTETKVSLQRSSFPLFQLEEPWRCGARVPRAAGPHRLSQLLQVPRRQSDSHQQWWHDMVSYFLSFMTLHFMTFCSERSYLIARKCDCPGNCLVAKFQIITKFREKKLGFLQFFKINFFVWRLLFFFSHLRLHRPHLIQQWSKSSETAALSTINKNDWKYSRFTGWSLAM